MGLTDDTLLDQPSCSRLNGVCAVIGNCPPGTRIELRGLCPDEEQYGMECCIPYKMQTNCCNSRSACAPKNVEGIGCTTKMCCQVSFLMCVFAYLVYSATVPFEKYNEVQVLSIPALQAPFFELPCMRIGGTCAKAFACPTGTRVGRKGLCPDQQELGIECCRPNRVARPVDKTKQGRHPDQYMYKGKTNTEKTCIFINGVCMASADECPEIMQIEGTSDCKHDEICCIYNQ
ncbi:hypothetical protein HW555_008473 [Spodoptera exigua]|uniref:Uncharacterized protein n=1 Tax=Spodoptera exigua TaxID=7107 RepID=A0A835L7T9_SPOEX|nr:hypothetical protein HW555_008473 [Spodoptera exigua]